MPILTHFRYPNYRKNFRAAALRAAGLPWEEHTFWWVAGGPQLTPSTRLRAGRSLAKTLLAALDETVEDQRRVRTRWELRGVVQSFRDSVTRLRKETRTALLTSKRAIDAHSASKREELLRSSAMREKQGSSDRTTEATLMKVNNDVTDALRRTMGLMQGELERSVLSVQMLGAFLFSLPIPHVFIDQSIIYIITRRVIYHNSQVCLLNVRCPDQPPRLLQTAHHSPREVRLARLTAHRGRPRVLRPRRALHPQTARGKGKRMVLEKAEEASVTLVEVMATAAHSWGTAGISSTVLMAAVANSSAISGALASSTSASFTQMKDEGESPAVDALTTEVQLPSIAEVFESVLPTTDSVLASTMPLSPSRSGELHDEL
ncbi:hypothetical protein EW146_g9972 [Bondarzewia mesenterica]|uniref:Uncharacterized protein n=1 Tax=Bondarzewia mesenterica TaxID=1095465 RepID=A0A4S4L6F6_9AGAM|nr:hypothetical protein EW146_g9972 [Bondarzewia mesenterica]